MKPTTNTSAPEIFEVIRPAGTGFIITLSRVACAADPSTLLGFSTPGEKAEIYVPAMVWFGDDCGGGGPTVSIEEAYALGAIPGTADKATGAAKWPESFWE